ncbi:MAG TPA: amidohydrolase family protein, partial [Solimonas sp.]
TALRKRGIRHLIGGDYGFEWSRQGTNARDLQFFVDYYGYSPSEALRCATRNGGLLMTYGSSEKQGEIAAGHLADLLLVDGDPLQDLSVMLKAERLVVIMKDGQIHKNASAAIQHRAAV